MKNDSLLRKPSAWIPLLMSLAVLIFLLGYVATFGVDQLRNGDEGTPACLFQLIMMAQLSFIAYFGIRYLPKQPKPSFLILVLQVVAWIVPILAVLWFEGL